MGFVCEGRYVLEPAIAEDAEKYVDVQLDCLEETYRELIGPEFGQVQRAERANWVEEFTENISTAGARAFLAYEVPDWTPEGGLSCAVGQKIDWSCPVGFALSRPGPLSWELDMPMRPVPEGTRELTHLYTRSSQHGSGLGQALFDAVLDSQEPAYLWYIMGNDRAVRFYEKNGFVQEETSVACEGSWAGAGAAEGSPARTARMFRGLRIA